tara:strand:+ start:847 stop:1596 length:750 start_codon:yes stop_codon:yes gene_type:complete
MDFFESLTTPAAPPAETPAAPEQQPPPAAPPAAEPDAGWNGEVEHLAKRPWYGKLSEQERKDIETGYKTKLKNYDTGYQKKFATLAEERRVFETERVEAERNKKLLALYGGDEESKKVMSELEDLRTYRTKAEEREAAVQQAATEKMAKEMETDYADILESDEATDTMAKLLDAGIPADRAAAFVRASIMPEPPKPSAYEEDWGAVKKVVSRRDTPSAVHVVGTGKKDLDSILMDAATTAEAKLSRSRR